MARDQGAHDGGQRAPDPQHRRQPRPARSLPARQRPDGADHEGRARIRPAARPGARRARGRGQRTSTASRRFPAPAAYLVRFHDFSIEYELRYWLEDYAHYLDVDSRVRERVWYRLEREGIAIAYPRDPPAAVPHGRPPAAPQSCRPGPRRRRGSALFAPLSAAERLALAGGARLVRFAEGETVVREGETGSSMFLIASGKAAVSVHGDVGASRKLAILEAGERVRRDQPADRRAAAGDGARDDGSRRWSRSTRTPSRRSSSPTRRSSRSSTPSSCSAGATPPKELVGRARRGGRGTRVAARRRSPASSA